MNFLEFYLLKKNTSLLPHTVQDTFRNVSHMMVILPSVVQIITSQFHHYHNSVCERNVYGVDCSEPCGYCKRGTTCDQVTGVCPGGCQDHWSGSKCDGKGIKYPFSGIKYAFLKKCCFIRDILYHSKQVPSVLLIFRKLKYKSIRCFLCTLI